MDTTWMDTQFVREGGGDDCDGGDTIYELVSCGMGGGGSTTST